MKELKKPRLNFWSWLRKWYVVHDVVKFDICLSFCQLSTRYAEGFMWFLTNLGYLSVRLCFQVIAVFMNLICNSNSVSVLLDKLLFLTVFL